MRDFILPNSSRAWLYALMHKIYYIDNKWLYDNIMLGLVKFDETQESCRKYNVNYETENAVLLQMSRRNEKWLFQAYEFLETELFLQLGFIPVGFDLTGTHVIVPLSNEVNKYFMLCNN